MTFQAVRRLALKFPGMEDGTSYGTRALKVRGKFLARLREDGVSLVIRAELPVREALMQRDPKVFYITDHYENYPLVLVNLDKVTPAKMSRLVEHAWRAVAPKRLVAAADAGRKAERKR